MSAVALAKADAHKSTILSPPRAEIVNRFLLVGGNKRGDKRWYEKNITIADTRFEKHLKKMEK
jgi:hypothetical protein